MLVSKVDDSVCPRDPEQSEVVAAEDPHGFHGLKDRSVRIADDGSLVVVDSYFDEISGSFEPHPGPATGDDAKDEELPDAPFDRHSSEIGVVRPRRYQVIIGFRR